METRSLARTMRLRRRYKRPGKIRVYLVPRLPKYFCLKIYKSARYSDTLMTRTRSFVKRARRAGGSGLRRIESATSGAVSVQAP